MTDGTSGSGYYGRPVLKPPVWKWYIPAYFFTGGLAAGSSLLAAGARVSGDGELARRCQLSALGAVTVSGVLLVADLGRPARFLNMLRVARVTSPMSVGSWVLAAFGSATGVAAAGDLFGLASPVTRTGEAVAAALAPVVGTYTAVLISDTAVPLWHEARTELPFVFAGGALASAAGLALLLGARPPVRRAAVAGAALELAASTVMKRRLGELAEPLHHGPARRLSTLATAATAAGAALAAGSSRHAAARAAGALLLSGAAAERFAVFAAGVESARDPKYTVEPQRRRLLPAG